MKKKRLQLHEWFLQEIAHMNTHGIMGAQHLSRMAREVEIPQGHEEILAAWEVSIHRIGLASSTIDQRFRRSILEQKAEAHARAGTRVVGGQAGDPQTIGFPHP